MPAGKSLEEKPCCASNSAETPADEVQTDMQEALASPSQADVPAAEATAAAAAASSGSTEHKATQEHASGGKKLRRKLHKVSSLQVHFTAWVTVHNYTAHPLLEQRTALMLFVRRGAAHETPWLTVRTLLSCRL